MSESTSVAFDGAAFDPRKRVHYTNGLVLGVDEFNQEQHYFLARHRGHARKLHGYGTTCGLRVFSQSTGKDAQVVVEPGTAVLPSGRTVHVDPTQCAGVQDWIDRHPDELADQGLPGPLSLYVVLGHRECATDLVPLPSAACGPQEESSAASRVTESFELALALEPPEAAEKLGERRFGRFLSWLRILDPGSPVDVEDFFARIRALAQSDPPDQPFGLPADQAESLVRAAFRVWVTELRPVLQAADQVQDRLLLARITATLADDGSGGWTVSGAVDVDEEERPVLLPTGLVAESGVPLAVAVAQFLTPPPATPLAASAPTSAKRKAAPKKAAAKKPSKAAKTTKTSKTGRAARRRKSPPGGATES